jgi:hypothetical protein
MKVNDPKDTPAGSGPGPAPRRRPYAPPRLTEYGSVAKLTQGTRTTQQDSPGATTFKRAACL